MSCFIWSLNIGLTIHVCIQKQIKGSSVCLVVFQMYSRRMCAFMCKSLTHLNVFTSDICSLSLFLHKGLNSTVANQYPCLLIFFYIPHCTIMQKSKDWHKTWLRDENSTRFENKYKKMSEKQVHVLKLLKTMCCVITYAYLPPKIFQLSLYISTII